MWKIIEGRWQDAGLRSMTFDHMITDPPYDARTHAGYRTLAGGDVHHETFGFDEMADKDISDLVDIAGLSVRRWSLIFCTAEMVGTYARFAGESWIRAGAWFKTAPCPQFTGDRPGAWGESIAIIHPGGKKRWDGGGRSARWTHPVEKAERYHPTPKPVGLIMQLIEDFTDPGETILDPYCGAASIGVAAIRLGRNYVGVEVDPVHAQTARDRMMAEEKGVTLASVRDGQVPLFGGKE